VVVVSRPASSPSHADTANGAGMFDDPLTTSVRKALGGDPIVALGDRAPRVRDSSSDILHWRSISEGAEKSVPPTVCQWSDIMSIG
jgi:hypothetical protein